MSQPICRYMKCMNLCIINRLLLLQAHLYKYVNTSIINILNAPLIVMKWLYYILLCILRSTLFVDFDSLMSILLSISVGIVYLTLHLRGYLIKFHNGNVMTISVTVLSLWAAPVSSHREIP